MENKAQIITVDTADMAVGLSVIEHEQMFNFLAKCREARQYRGLQPLQGIFVNVDDPAFQDVLLAYQGHHELPTDPNT